MSGIQHTMLLSTTGPILLASQTKVWIDTELLTKWFDCLFSYLPQKGNANYGTYGEPYLIK